MSSPIFGIWTDDHEGIPNGWMERTILNLDGDAIVQDWTHGVRTGEARWIGSLTNQTVKNPAGEDMLVPHFFGDYVTRLSVSTTSGTVETTITQSFNLTEQERGKPMYYYAHLWQSVYNNSTTDRAFEIRVGTTPLGSELALTNVASNVLNVNLTASSFTTNEKVVYFSIYYKATNVNTNNDFFIIDAFGPYRALASGSELAIQRSFAPTTFSSEALISNTSWSSESLISNTSWSSADLYATGSFWTSEALISNTSWT